MLYVFVCENISYTVNLCKVALGAAFQPHQGCAWAVIRMTNRAVGFVARIRQDKLGSTRMRFRSLRRPQGDADRGPK